MKLAPRPKGSALGKHLIKLQPGDSIKGVFRGEAHKFYQHWVDERSVLCTGRSSCDLCGEGDKGSFRFQLNFVTSENGALVAKVFEQGGRVYDALVALAGDLESQGRSLDTMIVKVTRNGSKKQTTYAITPQLDPISASDMSTIAGLKLHDLGAGAPPADEPEDDVDQEPEWGAAV